MVDEVIEPVTFEEVEAEAPDDAEVGDEVVEDAEEVIETDGLILAERSKADGTKHF
jgi:hypothetical protein